MAARSTAASGLLTIVLHHSLLHAVLCCSCLCSGRHLSRSFYSTRSSGPYTSSCSHTRGNEALATSHNAGRSLLPTSLRLRCLWFCYYAKGNYMQRSCRSKSYLTSMPSPRDRPPHTPDQLCDRSFGNVTFVGAHDSYAVGTNSRTFSIMQ